VPAAPGLNRPAAEKTEWRGKIVDESGLPIQGIVVEVIDAVGRSLLETQSDQEGKFSFANVAAAKIRVKHPDFEPVEQAVGLSSEGLIVTLRSCPRAGNNDNYGHANASASGGSSDRSCGCQSNESATITCSNPGRYIAAGAGL
jgi:hypothetical protein